MTDKQRVRQLGHSTTVATYSPVDSWGLMVLPLRYLG